MRDLSGKVVAIITENGFEESEFTSPKNALEVAGAEVQVVSPQRNKVTSWNEGNWGKDFNVDKHISEVNSEDYDAVIIPGGVINPDTLRRCKDSVAFITKFFKRENLWQLFVTVLRY